MDGVMRGNRMHGPASLRLSVSKALPKRLRDGIRELSHLETLEAERGKGYASMLMQKVCNEADKSRIVLMLTPTEGMTDFYKQFGFKVIQELPGKLMARVANARR